MTFSAPRGSQGNDTHHDAPAKDHGREEYTGIDVYDPFYYIVGKFVGKPKLAT
jgi:hypothetical protein